MGEGDLFKFVAGHLSVYREHRHLTHGVPADLERGDGFLTVVENQEDQEVRQVVVVVDLDVVLLVVIYEIIRADEQNGRQMPAQGVILPLIFDGGAVPSGQFLGAHGGGVPGFHPFLVVIQAQTEPRHQQHIQNQQKDSSAFFH